MRNLITSLKKPAAGVALGTALGLFAAMPGAQAFNFPVFGPSYEGQLPRCEAGLPTITTQFWEKERKFWNSPLRITAYGNVHERAFRPRESDNIPRRYCTAEAMVSDGIDPHGALFHCRGRWDRQHGAGRRVVRGRPRSQLGLQSGLSHRPTVRCLTAQP